MTAPGADPLPLPMAPAGCELDAGALGEQLERYRGLGATATGVTRDGAVARVEFDVSLDAQLLERTLEVERGCCSFLTLDYDADTRTLTLVAPAQSPSALDPLLAALAHGRA